MNVIKKQSKLRRTLSFLLLSTWLVETCAEIKTNTSSISGLSVTQQTALEKVKEQVMPHLTKDYMKEDFYLTRWLAAKDWKMADAEAMLTQNLQWRKQNRIDNINEENWTEMLREYPYQIDTFDKDGRPVGTLSIGKKWNIRRAVSQGRVPRLQRYMYKILEDLTTKVHEVRKNGKNVTQWSAIIDASGFGLLNHACPSCIPVWVNFVKSASERYPGYVQSITLINVPRPLVRILRPVFSSDLLKIFGNDKKSWMAYLDGKIDKDARTPEYGGTRV